MAELHGVSSCVFWAEGRRLELILAAEGEGVLFPRAEGSILILVTWNRKHLGPGVWAAKTGGHANWPWMGSSRPWASPLRWCFYSVKIVDSAPTTADLSPLD